jgi:hypothetical protein
MYHRFHVSGTVAVVLASLLCERLQAEEMPQGLSVAPAAVDLHGSRAIQRIQVSARFAEGDVRDVTHLATFTSSDEHVATVTGFIVSPAGDGTATLTVRYEGLEATLDVTVTGADHTPPVSFQTEMLAALTQAGCNMGACHGSPSGKGMFRLSLRGYDPPLDLLTLRTEDFGRRTNWLDPDASLLLKKPLMQVAHGGGKRLSQGDVAHEVMRNWIAEGMRVDPPEAPELERIAVFPAKRVFQPGADRQQLIVSGHFSDGTVRDLTDLTVFESSADEVATVDEQGLVRKSNRGETTILARYLDKMATADLTFLETVPGFVWNEPEPESFIDRLIEDKLQQLQILPSELCSDEEFLRRVHLDLTGLLPTLEETTAFLADSSPDKRAALVDRLLDSHAHAAFWGQKWADVLRVNSKTLQPDGVHKFMQWIIHGVRTDQPMDRFAYELLTARGSVFENPPANYWRASREPDDAVESTAQLFLGIRIQCAKCHNHPFERWSQDDYYGTAAAFTRIGRKSGLRENEEIIFVERSGEMTQPRTGQTMQVRLLEHADVDVPDGTDRREVFADWLTGPDNPFFAKSVVNRIWGHLLGRGIVDPVDDFRDSNPPSNAALLEELARRFVEQGYSRKWLIRQIVASKAYQRSATPNEFNRQDELYHSRAVPRMLSAEQLLDAISQVSGMDESFSGAPAGTPATQLPEPQANHEFLKAFGQPERTIACECERGSDSSLTQALQMINGATVHNKLRDEQGRLSKQLASEKSDEEIITEIYLLALCRPPDESERKAALAHITGSEDRRLALEDVYWAVLNSKEFLFQH